MILSIAARVLHKGLREIDLRLTKRRQIHGFAVHHASVRLPSERAFAAVSAALAVIHVHDPRRYRSLPRYMPRIVIAAQSDTVYWRNVRACALSDKQLIEQPPVWIASGIVHEAVHARLHQRGFRQNATRRPREEALCVREEIRFLQRIPSTEPIIAHLHSELARGSWYSEESRQLAVIDRMEALEAPRWIITWMKRKLPQRNNGSQGTDLRP